MENLVQDILEEFVEVITKYGLETRALIDENGFIYKLPFGYHIEIDRTTEQYKKSHRERMFLYRRMNPEKEKLSQKRNWEKNKERIKERKKKLRQLKKFQPSEIICQ